MFTSDHFCGFSICRLKEGVCDNQERDRGGRSTGNGDPRSTRRSLPDTDRSVSKTWVGKNGYTLVDS